MVKKILLNQFLKHFSLDNTSTERQSESNPITLLAKWLEDQYGVPRYATLKKWKHLTSLNTNTQTKTPDFSSMSRTSITRTHRFWKSKAYQFEKGCDRHKFQVCKFTRADTHNNVQLKDFKPLKLIGTGHYGKVFLVERLVECFDEHEHTLPLGWSNKFFALKVVEKVDSKCFDEFVAMKKLGASNLTSRLHFCFETSKAMYFVMDFAQGGDLFTYNHRNNITENNIRLIASSVVQALQHVHSNKMIYRDLKLENVLLTKTGHAVLSDFGLCSFHDVFTPKATGFCGTRPYIAPEIYKRGEYTNKVDSYSLGVMLAELMGDIQDPPTDEKYAPPTISHYRQQRFSKNLVDLVNKLIEQDPNTRLSITQIKNHPFFKNINWDMVEQRQYDGLSIKCTNSKDVSNFDTEFTDVSINDEFKHLFNNNKKIKLLFP